MADKIDTSAEAVAADRGKMVRPLEGQKLCGDYPTVTPASVAVCPICDIAECRHIREARIDDDAVNKFTQMMRDKMAKSREKGRGGWSGPTQCSVDYLRTLLYEHVAKGDPVDVANLCMMLHHYEASTAPVPVTLAQALEVPEVKALVERTKSLVFECFAFDPHTPSAMAAWVSAIASTNNALRDFGEAVYHE